jgi:hypothetical protein
MRRVKAAMGSHPNEDLRFMVNATETMAKMQRNSVKDTGISKVSHKILNAYSNAVSQHFQPLCGPLKKHTSTGAKKPSSMSFSSLTAANLRTIAV